MTARAERQLPRRIGHQGARAFQHTYDRIFTREFARRARPVGLHGFGGYTKQTSGLPRMRGNDAAFGQRQGRASQQVEGIGVPHLWHLAAGHRRQQAAPPGRLAEARANHQHRSPLDRRHQLIGRMHAQAHHLGQAGHGRGHMLRPGDQRHQPGAAAQSGFGTEQRRAAGTAITTDHQHMAEVAFMSAGMTWRQGRKGDAGEPMRLVCGVFGLRHGSKALMSGRIIRT
ncbi:hypothetical protein D3C79_758590 [compost metagenome]